ncbi:MAG TPA: hypothetical protein DCP98_07885 [Sphaerochaeta sp.]|nr:hypothetical protein [Sphaerochaeta sp.]
MSIDIHNHEGYVDPTPYHALKKESRALRAFRPIVYICSPYSGDVQSNVENARKYSRFAVDKGYIPIAPHLLFPQFLDDNDEAERKLGLFFGTAIMSRCSEIWVFGDKPTHGMRSEIKRAVWKNYRIRFFTEDMEEVKK